MPVYTIKQTIGKYRVGEVRDWDVSTKVRIAKQLKIHPADFVRDERQEAEWRAWNARRQTK